MVTAVDAHTGELVTFDGNSGVDLVDAVTAATALPGSSPTIGINGIHYINGGVRSPDNVDLASGYANVVVLSPFGGRSRTLPEGQIRGPPQTTGMGPGPGGSGRGSAPAGQPRRGDHPGRRFPRCHGHEPDGPGHPHAGRPRRFRPRQAGSDPRDLPLTIEADTRSSASSVTNLSGGSTGSIAAARATGPGWLPFRGVYEGLSLRGRFEPPTFGLRPVQRLQPDPSAFSLVLVDLGFLAFWRPDLAGLQDNLVDHFGIFWDGHRLVALCDLGRSLPGRLGMV